MEKLKKSFGAFLVPLLSILMAFIIGGIIMAALGADPFLAVKFLFQGAFGSKAGIGTTLAKATPLMFTALCACFAYRCGVFNLGGEGQFLMGSIAAFLTCYFTGLTGFGGIVLALLAGAVAGGSWGMIPGVLKITRGQNEMIISIMLNYVATLLMGVIYTSWIRDFVENDKAAGKGKRRFHRIGEPPRQIWLHDQTVHHDLNMVLFILVELDLFRQIIDAAVCAHARIAAAPCIVEDLDMLALFSAHDGGQNLKARALRQLHDLIDDLIDRLAFDFLAAFRAVRHAAARPKKAQVVIDFRHRADRGAGVFAGGLLVDRNGGRQTVDGIDVGLVHLS